MIQDKIIPFDQLAAWRATVSGRLVVTNGCFDILHAGHVMYLERARSHGDVLLVGVNGDKAVAELKGAGRPVNKEADRATVIAALESVAAVTIFPQVRATRLLELSVPDVWVKGGDYTAETLNKTERETVISNGGQIIIVSLVDGKSTTKILQKIKEYETGTA